ncbi:MAG TPA: hypothetical protein VIX41_05575 [Acidimicrobiales bacterium]
MSGIAAPAPVVYVTVLGSGPDDVTVRDVGTHAGVVRVELGTEHIAGPLDVVARVLARAADVEAARLEGDPLCSGSARPPGLCRRPPP